MKKPLWIFFNRLRERTPILLSIDQYFYFLQAFQQVPLEHISHYHDLREFCKVFWLKNYEYEREFNAAFEAFVDWETLRKEFLIISEEISEEEKKETTGKETTVKPVKPQPETSFKKPIPGKVENREEEQTDTEYVNFDLVIREEKGTTQREAATPFVSKHLFRLNDQDIMPFKLRHFAQRLRRKVETPVKELTEELDFERMIDQYSKLRYIDEIVFHYRDSSRSNVILLADRYGSMLSYEYLETHLQNAILAIPDCRFEHYYFKNLPMQDEETGHYQMKSARGDVHILDSGNTHWDANSWFFIFSDAGAHSGMYHKSRLRATLNMWNYFRKISPHVYWFNPVPDKYMGPSTARRLRSVIPMVCPVQDELIKFFNQL